MPNGDGSDNDLDQRLAQLRAEQADAALRAPQGVVSRARELRERYWRRRKRGDALLFASALLIVGVVMAALVVLVISIASGGGDKPAAAVVVRPTATRARPATATAVPTATTVQLPTTVPPPAPLVRQDCDAVRGTSYLSEEERAYFQQNCLGPQVSSRPPTAVPTRPPSAPTSAPPAVVQPTAVPPAPTPVPPSSDASNAIALAVDWITNSAKASYTTNAGSCNAVQAGGHWVVTCTAHIVGCQGSVCDTVVSVCVLSNPARVRPSDQC